VILSLGTVVIPLQPKIRTTTATNPLTVPCFIKEPGGTRVVTHPTLTVCIITDSIHQALMVSTGMHGKDTVTPLRELS